MATKLAHPVPVKHLKRKEGQAYAAAWLSPEGEWEIGSSHYAIISRLGFGDSYRAAREAGYVRIVSASYEFSIDLGPTLTRQQYQALVEACKALAPKAFRWWRDSASRLSPDDRAGEVKAPAAFKDIRTEIGALAIPPKETNAG